MKTYGDIYDEFYNKFPNADVEDYRPASATYIQQLMGMIQNSIVIWFKDGSRVIYIAESEE
jgi:hypothetical protein